MFRKPFKIKSNNQLKGSDRKAIKDLFLKTFPTVTETEFENIFPKKEIIQVAKVLTALDEIVQIYLIDQRPIFFLIKEIVVPSVFLLWKNPNLVPSFTTHAQVFSKFISSGADLMLPGVVTPPSHSGLTKYGNLEENNIAYVNTTTNKAAVAVGVTAQSSSNMMASGQKGKCLIIYHSLGDKLCNFKSACPPIPDLGPPVWLSLSNYNEDFPELGHQTNVAAKDTTNINGNINSEDNDLETEIKEDSNELSEATSSQLSEPNQVSEEVSLSVEEMDQLLIYCFLVAIKYSKTLSLPMLTSNFYKLQMLPVCPEGKRLDIKKTSYKKMKPFLDAMTKDGVITIQETKKGVESITAVNRDHPKVTEFYLDQKLRPKKHEEDTGNQRVARQVTESYIITQNVLPLFSDFGYRKNDLIQMTELRKCITEYVKKYDCQNSDNKKFVQPKEHLIKICKTSNNITWEELMEKTCNLMKNCYTVATETEQITNKGKVSPITLTISKRANSKKVTLVDNLESFGIRIADFAKECQHGVAASTSVNKIPGKNSEQLLIQGNQIPFVYNLLRDKYKIPIKYIKGLENAPKTKK